MFLLTRLVLHVFSLVTHSLSFRRSMSGAALVILLDIVAGCRYSIIVPFVALLHFAIF